MVHWSEYFWGEGNRGLEIFSNNVKNGAIAIEEFQRFLNERKKSRTIESYNVSQRIVKIYLVYNHNYTKLNIWAHLNTALHIVNKAKEQCHSIGSDYERAKRANSNVSNNSSSTAAQENSSPSLAQSAMNSLSLKQLERLEKKYRLAQDDYKSTVDKYNLIR
ncbi:unnamed protein product, partial [Rotaria magnacalcarata]